MGTFRGYEISPSDGGGHKFVHTRAAALWLLLVDLLEIRAGAPAVRRNSGGAVVTGICQTFHHTCEHPEIIALHRYEAIEVDELPGIRTVYRAEKVGFEWCLFEIGDGSQAAAATWSESEENLTERVQGSFRRGRFVDVEIYGDEPLVESTTIVPGWTEEDERQFKQCVASGRVN